jgi:6-phosphofructokinase 1
MATLKGTAIVFTQGGPTAVINATWVGVVLGLRNAAGIENVWGAVNGIDGVLKEHFVDLRAQDADHLMRVAHTPSSQLRSTRHKPNDEDNQAMLHVFEKYNIRYVFGIGGNDTSESLDLIHEAAKRENYDLRMFHLAKTVDNDLMESDHTPGYGSAARYVANAFRGVDLDNECFGGFYLGVCMGRHAGFLTAASALGRRSAESGPHLVYLPERPFDVDRFCENVEAVYRKHNRCVVAVSEGIEDKNHTPILQALAADGGQLEADSHGNVQLSGTGALADILVARVRAHLEGKGVVKKLRARGDTLGYIQRSFPDESPVDLEETLGLGKFAAEQALAGETEGSCAIVRASEQPYRAGYRLVPLKKVAGKTRRMPDHFIHAAANDVTPAFLDYGRPLVGELSPFGRLDLAKRVPAQ